MLLVLRTLILSITLLSAVHADVLEELTPPQEDGYSLNDLLDVASVRSLSLLPRDTTITSEEVIEINFFCDTTNAQDFVIRFLPCIFAVIFPYIGHAVGGDHLTGNAFVEGSDEDTLVATRLNRSFEMLHHISLENLQEIFMHLREDIVYRTHYIKNRPDGDAIMQVLRNRELRLLQSLHDVEQTVFHFREHPSLHRYQRNIAIAVGIIAPIALSLLVAASFDFQTKEWATPTEAQFHANLARLKQALNF